MENSHPYSGTYIVIIIAYVLVMLAIGWWCMRRTKSVGDFFLGGRNLGPWMSALAFGTTYFSAVIFIGYAGKLGWQFGIYTLGIVIGNTIIGTVLSWWLLAGRTRDMTVKLNAHTMPEFLGRRYDSKPLQIVAALVVFIFLVPYSASVLMGLSYLFEMTMPFRLGPLPPYETALLFLTLLTAVYLTMGGYFAVAVTDFVRGIVEFVGVMLMVYLIAYKFGGMKISAIKLLENPKITAPVMDKIIPIGATEWLGMKIPEGFIFEVQGMWILVALIFITSIGPWALPQMVQKFYSIRSKMDITRTIIIAGIFSLFMAFGAYFSGAMTHLQWAGELPSQLMDGGAPVYDKIMPYFITSNEIDLPIWLVMVIVLTVFSASMSSLSSLVLVSSSAISIDIIGLKVDKDKNPKKMMTILRVFCIIFVGASLFLALVKFDVIVNLMVMSWSTLAGVFLAPFVYGLFWKRITRAGAWSGVIAGIVCAVTLFPLFGPNGVPLAGVITILVPMIIVPIVSLFTKQLPKELVETAFTAPIEGLK